MNNEMYFEGAMNKIYRSFDDVEEIAEELDEEYDLDTYDYEDMEDLLVEYLGINKYVMCQSKNYCLYKSKMDQLMEEVWDCL